MSESQSEQGIHLIRQEIARWTHAWMCAAALILERIERSWDDDAPAISSGENDALTMVVVSAVRNTYRGARAALGSDSPSVKTFERQLPELNQLRDRLEHFDDYLRGKGWDQRGTGDDSEAPDAISLLITGSSGGGPGGHTIEVAVRERGGCKPYILEMGRTVDLARALACAAIKETDLYDERHALACRFCPA